MTKNTHFVRRFIKKCYKLVCQYLKHLRIDDTSQREIRSAHVNFISIISARQIAGPPSAAESRTFGAFFGKIIF